VALAKDQHLRATAIQLLEIPKDRQDQQEKAHLLETEDHLAIENLSALTEDLAAVDQLLEKLGNLNLKSRLSNIALFHLTLITRS
jgi:hypothetical protein